MPVDPNDVCAIIVTRGDVDLDEILDSLPYGELLVRQPLRTLIYRRDEAGKWEFGNAWHEHEDAKIYGRYLATAYTQKPYVYFQDDDVLFLNHMDLLEDANEENLVCNMDEDWIDTMGYYDLAMVGKGAIAPRHMPMRTLKRYLAAFPDNDDFRLYCDFAFTALCPWQRADYGGMILPVASAPGRLWNTDSEAHLARRAVIMNQARSLRTVVLTIMAKNEEENIGRAIESAKGLYDVALVVDTGSTDRTVEVARAHGAVVTRRKWVNFGHNRQEMLEIGRLMGDYMLLMDADEELTDQPSCWPNPLFLDAYVLHYDGPADVGHPRLIYSNYGWRFEGRIHGALYPTENLPSVGDMRVPQIHHHGDVRHDPIPKLTNDIQVLTEEIAKGNDVPRHLFHRGKAYEGLRMYDEAMSDYEARCAFQDGLDEEVFYSLFRLGCLHVEHRNSFTTGADLLMQAWIFRPSRIEPLRMLAHYCTAIADKAPYPRSDSMLVLRDMYRTHPGG